MDAELAKFLTTTTDNLAAQKEPDGWRWERLTIGKTIWKIGIGRNEKGRLEIRITERI